MPGPAVWRSGGCWETGRSEDLSAIRPMPSWPCCSWCVPQLEPRGQYDPSQRPLGLTVQGLVPYWLAGQGSRQPVENHLEDLTQVALLTGANASGESLYLARLRRPEGCPVGRAFRLPQANRASCGLPAPPPCWLTAACWPRQGA